MLKEILKKGVNENEASPEIQKIWDKFDKEYMVFKKELRKADVDRMVLSELDDYEYEMFNLLGVK